MCDAKLIKALGRAFRFVDKRDAVMLSIKSGEFNDEADRVASNIEVEVNNAEEECAVIES